MERKREKEQEGVCGNFKGEELVGKDCGTCLSAGAERRFEWRYQIFFFWYSFLEPSAAAAAAPPPGEKV